jgi:hypothetical protein
MDKKILRTVIEGLQANQQVSIRMRGRATAEDFTVIQTKRGKGKHGSLTATVQRGDGTVLSIGTPKNLDVLNITVNGNFYGVQSEREEPPVYKTDDARATQLKTSLSPLVGEAGKGRILRLESSVPEFNGTFTVVNGRLEKGKYGQVHLWLVPEGQTQTEENTVELWSYRHSGVIENFEVPNA